MINERITGLVFVKVSTQSSKEEIIDLAAQACECVSPGRTIAAVWQVPHAWIQQNPIEGWLTTAVSGDPASRRESKEVGTNFFGNLAVRAYRRDALKPTSTYQVALYRRAGAAPYVRAKDADAPIETARLDTKAYAFTRDYANNVWHLPQRQVERAILSRLARLVCWPDERVAVLDRKGLHRLRKWPVSPTGDLVGVPEKYDYGWSANGHTQLPLIAD